MPQQVLIAAPISQTFKEFLTSCNFELVYNTDAANLVGVVTSNKLLINAAFIDAHPYLQWIARLGSGLEIIDTDYCKQKNIFVCSSPKGIAPSVGQHALGMLLSMLKNIATSNAQVQQAQWIREPNRGCELDGHTIGLIGYGHTAQAFAKLLSVFNVQVLAYDIAWHNSMPLYNNTHKSTLAQIYAQANVVSYHVPLNAQTANYYQPTAFAKPHILINTARGAICSTQNILHALHHNMCLAACLDVLDFEHIQPFTVAEKASLECLYKHNCIITPHIAGYSYNAIQNMSAELQNALTHFFAK